MYPTSILLRSAVAMNGLRKERIGKEQQICNENEHKFYNYIF